jgi:hypothetical protein
MTNKPNRRVFLAGVAASSVASTIVLASELGEMPRLIAAHRASRVELEEVQDEWLRVRKEFKEKLPDPVLADAERIFSEISAAETDALQAVCAHVCLNHEEEKLRAEYLISEKIIDELEITDFFTILRSLVNDGAEV